MAQLLDKEKKRSTDLKNILHSMMDNSHKENVIKILNKKIKLWLDNKNKILK